MFAYILLGVGLLVICVGLYVAGMPAKAQTRETAIARDGLRDYNGRVY